MLKWIWVSIVVLILDQLSKWMAVAHLDERVPEAILPHLNFTLAYNYGAAFSFLGDQSGWQRWFLVVISFVVSGYIIYWLRKLDKNEFWTAISLALVLGGALGNGLDRLVSGRVTDFIDLYTNLDVFFLSDGHFAIFNGADIAITLGAILLVVNSFATPDGAELSK
ncbi:signal peptidase II [Leucothrix pacifica]|uniref:Lipoprotein signal peptidase n=1 Tax=Leucothrix pacifica TaxID=1247513 RepID=A0A317CE41_9GAMM|nr:signal peptidase II [Leucothrix pacifica]PWQ94402.1 signal peptidase II [Leucothrix pacifica]